jgi:hypothetical protein
VVDLQHLDQVRASVQTNVWSRLDWYCKIGITLQVVDFQLKCGDAELADRLVDPAVEVSGSATRVVPLQQFDENRF